MIQFLFKVSLFLFFSFSINVINSQEILKADSTLSNLYYEVGIGFSNVGEMVLRGIDNQAIFPEHDQLTISLSQHTKSDKYIRFGFVMGFYKEVVVGGKNNLINPFIVTAGIEKKKTKNRWVLSYGSDLYYITTIKGVNVGGQYWQAQNSGFGISGLVSGSYFIQHNLSIRTETEIGFGVQQKFKNAGFVSQKVLSPSIVPIKTLSLELKYHF
jgi:hypothetical protein